MLASAFPMSLAAWRQLAGAGGRPPNAERHRLSNLKQKLLRLGSMVEESAVLARAVLAVPDLEAAPQIRRGDDMIDGLYRELEEDCAQPVSYTPRTPPKKQEGGFHGVSCRRAK